MDLPVADAAACNGMLVNDVIGLVPQEAAFHQGRGTQYMVFNLTLFGGVRNGTVGKPTQSYGEESINEDDGNYQWQAVAIIDTLCVIAVFAMTHSYHHHYPEKASCHNQTKQHRPRFQQNDDDDSDDKQKGSQPLQQLALKDGESRDQKGGKHKQHNGQ